MDEEELRKILNRMGNDVFQLVALARNLGLDYGELVRVLGGGGKVFQEGMGFSETLDIVHWDKDGKILGERHLGPSPVRCLTKYGFKEVAGLIALGIGGTAFSYIGIGTGTTAETKDDSALETEVKRKAGTVTRVTTTEPEDTMQIVTTFAAADTLSGTQAITESGVMNAAVAGTMLCRQTFTVQNINWGAGDTYQVTWKIQAKQGG